MRNIMAGLVGVLALGAVPLAMAQTAAWQTYTDEIYGFSAELPLGQFEVVETADAPGMALRETDGLATINLYGGPADGMTRDALEMRLETGSDNTTTTYGAGGDSWFVLSGFYDRGEVDDTIFYTKVLFSPDHRTFSAFEITFPTNEKPRFEAMVERFEDSFTRPRS